MFASLVRGASAAIIMSVCAATQAQVSFTEVSTTHGIGTDPYGGGGPHCLGMNWIDYDADGDPDIFAVNGYDSKLDAVDFDAHLFRNNGDGTFTKVDELLPALPRVEMMASVYADYDRDGDPDIYIFTDHEVTSPGGGNDPDGPPNILLKNLWVESGGTASPLFEDVAPAAGVDDLVTPPFGPYPAYRSATGGFFDYDRDGWIDLYVGHCVPGSGGELTNVDRIYHNDRDGTFTDVTGTCGVHNGSDTSKLGPALAGIACHLDNDLWPDIYAGNIGPAPWGNDHYYQNNGDGSFTDVIASSVGMGDDAGAAMGITVADIELDGDWDMYITDKYFSNDEPPNGNPLYLGNGDGTFTDNVAVAAGVWASDSWGANFLDLDHDGYEDLFVVTMKDMPDYNFVYMNNQDGTFTNIAPGSGIDHDANGRGSAYADYDGDGDLDIAVVYRTGKLHVYRNDLSNSNHWLMVKLEGTRSNPEAIGTVVKVTAGELTMMRQVIGGDSGHAQNAFDLHFGLGAERQADLVEIFWPCGGVQRYENVLADQHVTYVETFTADTDADGAVGITDLLNLLGGWGPCSECPGCLGDLDGDGVIGVGDLLQMLANWG